MLAQEAKQDMENEKGEERIIPARVGQFRGKHFSPSQKLHKTLRVLKGALHLFGYFGIRICNHTIVLRFKAPSSMNSGPRRNLVTRKDDVREDMEEVMGMLMTSHRLSPDSHSDDPYRPRKTAEQLRKELEQLKADEKMEADRREARRPKKRRKFEGLGLDSSDDDSTDGMTIDKAKKKLAEYNEEDEGWDHDDSDAEGNTAWERSPFFSTVECEYNKG